LTNEGFSSFGKGGSEMFVLELGSELLDRIDESVDLSLVSLMRITGLDMKQPPERS
jgi:hypothetical protein